MRSCRRFGSSLGIHGSVVYGLAVRTLSVAGLSVLSFAGNARAQSLPVAPVVQQQGAASASSGAGFNPAYRGSQQDYPAAEVQTVPIASARAATARAEEDQLMSDLHSTVDRMWEDFNYSDTMVAAVKEENDAYLQYDDARRKALETLSGDPTYRAVVSLVSTLKSKLEDERPRHPKPLPEDLERVLATATLKLSYASSASAMEAAALSADEHVQETRARLVSAGQKTASLRTDFDGLFVAVQSFSRPVVILMIRGLLGSRRMRFWMGRLMRGIML